MNINKKVFFLLGVVACTASVLYLNTFLVSAVSYNYVQLLFIEGIIFLLVYFMSFGKAAGALFLKNPTLTEPDNSTENPPIHAPLNIYSGSLFVAGLLLIICFFMC